MKKRRGRPPKGLNESKGEHLELWVEAAEKRAFREAAELSALALPAWVRERLRLAARRELEDAGRAVAFLDPASDDVAGK